MKKVIRLVFDIGNTRTKCAVFENNDCLETITFSGTGIRAAGQLINRYGLPASAIISTVKSGKPAILEKLKRSGVRRVVILSPSTPSPLKIRYKTPESLGSDRLSNACAASVTFPGKPVLVIDAGTCIKYDFVSEKNEYLGGAISPGLKMRYSALHRDTGRLPRIEPDQKFPLLTGQSTTASIRSGVENGMLAEMNGIIDQYRKLHKSLKIILTGGDYQRFEDKLKSPIFVAPNLTLLGLKVILDHNEPKNR